jgi:UDPglucose 6-dehydrogenase
VVGLGKLGFPFACHWASRGYFVHGIDTNARRIDNLRRGREMAHEGGLASLWGRVRSQIRLHSRFEDEIAESSFFFLVLPTPSLPDGRFSNEFVLAACKKLAVLLKRKKSFFTVVIVSTVQPGSLQSKIRPFLEEQLSRPEGAGWSLAYNPQFIALGTVLKNLSSSDFHLLGVDSRLGRTALQRLYRSKFGSAKPIFSMSLNESEICKLAINSYLTMKISFANIVARYCERIGEADAKTILNAIGADSRIGQQYLHGGIGYGGPCFPRDNRAFSLALSSQGVDPHLSRASERVNGQQLDFLIKQIRAHHRPGTRVGLLGVAYKVGTDVTEGSQTLILAERLSKLKISSWLYDPAARPQKMARNIRWLGKSPRKFGNASVLVILTPWPSFRTLLKGNKLPVIDPWGLLN